MLTNGWIKFYRKITNWEWYKDSNTFHLFGHLLLTSNYEEKEWKGMKIKPGQKITGRKKLAEETGLSEQKIRTSLRRLQSTSNITIKSTNRYTLITICNYSSFQSLDMSDQPAEQPTNAPTTNHYVRSKEINNSIIKKHNTIVNGKPLTYYFEKIPLIFNSTVEPFSNIPKIIKLTDARKRVIKGRLGDELPTLPSWQFYFEWAMASEFIRNECKATSFDWLVQPRIITNIREGKYHHGQQQPKEEYK